MYSVFIHYFKQKYYENIIPEFYDKFKILDKESNFLKNSKLFRDFLVKEYKKSLPEVQQRIKQLYKMLGFYLADIKQLRSIFWWKKIYAIERLGELDFVESEQEIFNFIFHKRHEIRFATLRVLINFKSENLYKIILEFFEKNNR